MNQETKPVFPNFDDNEVSTKTFIVMTNITINMQKLFDKLPITEYVVVPKRRGRKKKCVVVNPNVHIPEGSIVTIEYNGNVRGVLLKKKKKKDVIGKNHYFRNSITIVMTLDTNFTENQELKKINFKISKNGKFQMTGCKHDHQAETCVKKLWEYIKDDEEMYVKTDDKPFTACLLYTSPSPRDGLLSRMPSSA